MTKLTLAFHNCANVPKNLQAMLVTNSKFHGLWKYITELWHNFDLAVSVPRGLYVRSRVEPSAFLYLALLPHEALQYACFFFY